MVPSKDPVIKNGYFYTLKGILMTVSKESLNIELSLVSERLCMDPPGI